MSNVRPARELTRGSQGLVPLMSDLSVRGRGFHQARPCLLMLWDPWCHPRNTFVAYINAAGCKFFWSRLWYAKRSEGNAVHLLVFDPAPGLTITG